MDILVKLAFDEAAAVRLLNWLAQEDGRIFAARRDLPWLYHAGVRYQREVKETWCDYLNLLRQGHEDCDGLAAARAGELQAFGWRVLHPDYLKATNDVLRAAGQTVPDTGFEEARKGNMSRLRAEVMLTTKSMPEKPGLYHCIVRYKVGNRWYRDDPSARLGMLGVT